MIQDNTSSPTRAWADWVGSTTAKVMAQIDAAFPGRVIGAQLIHGVSSEGNYPADWSSHMEGFKTPNAFGNYWADHSVGAASDFCRKQTPPPATCTIPTAMQRNRPTRGSTLVTADTAAGAAVVAYNRFINVQMAAGIASVGAALKRASGGRAFTTTLYGGILNAAAADPCRVVLAIDMDRIETARMPPPRDWTACDATVPLLHKVESLHFAAAILQYLESGPAEI